MGKRLITCAILAIAISLVIPANAYQLMNMITNGSFEMRTAASGSPSGWRFYTNEGSTSTWGYSPCTGGKDMRIVRTATGSETLLDNWNNMVPTTGGVTYKYKFVAKGSGTLSVCTGFMKTDNYTFSQTVSTFTLTSSYQMFTINATSPNGYAKAWIAFRLTGTGNFDIDDVTMIADPGAAQYPDAFSNLSFTYWGTANLYQVWGIGDGNDAWNVIWDKECRNTLNAANGHYQYFRIDDSFTNGNPGYKYAITVEYADTGTDTFALEYDGLSGAYTSAGTVTKTGTMEWKKKTFYIADAYFGGRQNGSSDFRISDQGDGAEYISYIAVSYWDSTLRSHARINSNHLEMNGSPTFLKTGSLAADYCNENLSGLGYPAQFQAKSYTAAKIIPYWFHFETVGDGSHGSMANLTSYINDCNNRGIKLGMTFETGAVGGGATPDWLFNWYNCQSYNSSGQPAIDSEYGTNFKIQSLSSDAFLFRSRDWMMWMLRQVDKTKISWYETAVEPQYIGNQQLDYSAAAYEKWHLWLEWRYSLAYLNSIWGTAYTNYDAIPMPTTSGDAKWSIWNIWRAYALASWINGDIQTIKNVVGEEALTAVDALIVTSMQQRMGDYTRVMNQINPNIFQVNWHWMSRAPYNTGYDTCVPIARTKNQAISEHMTLNGSDFVAADVDALLRHTLTKGNKFGWEFVNMRPSSGDPFSLYNDNWSAKPLINVMDSNNAYYMNLGVSYLTLPL